MIVRNPLERHLSAFNNKLSSSLEYNSTSLFDQLKRSMWERYHPVKLKEWISNGCKGKLRLDFATYLRWITDTPNHRLNEHFAPTVYLAQPCRIRYNFYGNFKNYSSDIKAVIARLGAPQDWYRDQSSHTDGIETRDMMVPAYSRVRREVKERLIKGISEDLEFYYTLFPEEEGSHVDILGLN